MTPAGARTGRRTPGRTTLLIAASGAFGLTITSSQVLSFILIATGVALTSLALRTAPRGVEGGDRWSAILIIGTFAALSIVGPVHDVIGDPPAWAFPVAGVTWLVFGLVWHRAGDRPVVARILFWSILVASAAFGAIHVVSAAGTGLDVWLLHETSADAIAAGVSPYTEAVTIPNGAPVGPPLIVGYPYPPITALAYSVGSWLGDARWLSLASWMLTLGLVGRRSLAEGHNPASLGTMLMLASVPGWPLVLTSAWTEPLSLALMAVAVLLWIRPAAWGAAFGLFAGSKQYLLALLPMLVIPPLGSRWQRVIGSGLGLLMAFTPLVVWGMTGFVDSAIRFHLDVPARPDGTSLVGLLDLLGISWAPPAYLAVAGILAVAVVAGRRAVTQSGWLAASALVLTTAFLLSSQAFPNYWFLVMGLVALAATTTQSETEAHLTAPPPPA